MTETNRYTIVTRNIFDVVDTDEDNILLATFDGYGAAETRADELNAQERERVRIREERSKVADAVGVGVARADGFYIVYPNGTEVWATGCSREQAEQFADDYNRRAQEIIDSVV